MTTPTLTIRIRNADWKKIRKIFKSYPSETAQSYFFRLRSFMETRYLSFQDKNKAFIPTLWDEEEQQ